MNRDCEETLRLIEEDIDGRLPPSASESVRDHLRGCAACAAEEESLRRVGELVRLWSAARAEEQAFRIEAIGTRVRAGIEERRVAAARRRRLVRWLAVPAAAAAIAVSILLFYPSDGTRAPFKPRSFDVAVESLESEDATVALVERGEDLPTVIWIIEDDRT